MAESSASSEVVRLKHHSGEFMLYLLNGRMVAKQDGDLIPLEGSILDDSKVSGMWGAKNILFVSGESEYVNALIRAIHSADQPVHQMANGQARIILTSAPGGLETFEKRARLFSEFSRGDEVRFRNGMLEFTGNQAWIRSILLAIIDLSIHQHERAS